MRIGWLLYVNFSLFLMLILLSPEAYADIETLKETNLETPTRSISEQIAQEGRPENNLSVEELDNAEFEDIDEDTSEVIPPALPEDLEIDETGGSFSLGIIRPVPTVSFKGRVSVIQNRVQDDDSFVSQDDINSAAIVNSAALRISPELGRSNRLEGGIQLNHIISGDELSDYNAFAADLGIRRELGQNSSVTLGWKYQQINSDAEKFSDQQARIRLNRIDPLNERLFLSSNYQADVSFAEISAQNRWSNTASANLAYSISPALLGQLGYRLQYTNYFESDSAINHQIGAQMTYYLDEHLSITGSAAYQFGEYIDRFTSSPSSEDISNISFGLHIGFDIPIAY